MLNVSLIILELLVSQTHGGSSGSSGGSSDSRWKFELGSTECRVPLAREEDLKFKS